MTCQMHKITAQSSKKCTIIFTIVTNGTEICSRISEGYRKKKENVCVDDAVKWIQEWALLTQ